MASVKRIRSKGALKDKDQKVVLHQGVLDLSKKIKRMESVVREFDAALRQELNDVDMPITYVDLAASLNKLTQAFETLHRHGNFGLESGLGDETIKPN